MPSMSASRTSSTRSAMSAGMGVSVMAPPSYSQASSLSRSATPQNPGPSEIGSSSGATPASNVSVSWSSTLSKETCSRSSLFTKNSRGSPASAARRQASAMLWSTPVVASTTSTTRSATAIAAHCSPAKSNDPGVSRRLILWSFHSKEASVMTCELPASRSSGS